jgi:outer membrane cobalamin receptor
MTFIPENDDFELYGKPAMTANLGIYAKPLSQLTLNLDYNLLSGMYAFVNQENVKMNAINDVRLRGSWQFNDTFSLYGQFNNLLFRQQEIFYGYPLQPFTAMAGININF